MDFQEVTLQDVFSKRFMTEDACVYHIYLPRDQSDITTLETNRKEFMTYLNTEYVKDYIWQDDPFQLRIYSVEQNPPRSENIEGMYLQYYNNTE
jgi:hypothetical protein